MDQDDDEEAKKHTFAPRDTKAVIFRAKEMPWGLGYVPGASLSESVDIGSGSGAGRGGPNISGELGF